MPGAGGQLRQGAELALVQPGFLPGLLAARRLVERVHISMQLLVDRGSGQPAVFQGQPQQIGQQQRVGRRSPFARQRVLGRPGQDLRYRRRRQLQRLQQLFALAAHWEPQAVPGLIDQRHGQLQHQKDVGVGAEGTGHVQRQSQMADHRAEPGRQAPAYRQPAGDGRLVQAPILSLEPSGRVGVAGQGWVLGRHGQPAQRGKQAAHPGVIGVTALSAQRHRLGGQGVSQGRAVDRPHRRPAPIDEAAFAAGKTVQRQLQHTGIVQQRGVKRQGRSRHGRGGLADQQ